MHCTSALTKVVNLSLSMGHFFEDWKLAIVRPLIKSLKKGTEKSNHKPVSSVQFISKVVENACSTNSLITATITTCCLGINLPTENTTAVRPVFSNW